jgi:putative nucleotidyltransferase with HDIG domain
MVPNNRVLFVDDDQAFLNAVSRLLRNKFEIFTLTDPKSALALSEQEGPFGVVVSDYKMPELDGVQYLRLMHQCFPDSERILLTGYPDLNVAVDAVNSAKVHSILTKPCPVERIEDELRAALQKYNQSLRTRELYKENLASLGEQVSSTMTRLSREVQSRLDDKERLYSLLKKVLAAKDQYTFLHSVRVSEMAGELAKKMNYTDRDVHSITMAALLHDLGKIYVASEILNKTSKLSPVEWDLIKYHPQAGFDLLSTVDLDKTISLAVYQHHERRDGSGYPNALRGLDIIPEAQIIAVCDVVEAMTNERPYRAALGHDAAMAQLWKSRGIHYRTDIVDECIKLLTVDRFMPAVVVDSNMKKS